MCDAAAGEMRWWIKALAREGVPRNRLHIADTVHALDHASLTALHEQLADRPRLRAEIAGVLADAELLGILPAAHVSRHPGTCDTAGQTIGWALYDVELSMRTGRPDRADAVDYLAEIITEDWSTWCELALLLDRLADEPGLRAEVAAQVRARVEVAT